MSNEKVIVIVNNDVLGRRESEVSKAKLQERMTQFLQDKEPKFHEAATRLQMKKVAFLSSYSNSNLLNFYYACLSIE